MSKASKATYAGGMQDGIREGRGKLTWPGGCFYEGEFHAGLRHGFGLYHQWARRNPSEAFCEPKPA